MDPDSDNGVDLIAEIAKRNALIFFALTVRFMKKLGNTAPQDPVGASPGLTCNASQGSGFPAD
eukprot:1703625-Rhodomonas_salina.3